MLHQIRINQAAILVAVFVLHRPYDLVDLRAMRYYLNMF